jgi:hypothetical protein
MNVFVLTCALRLDRYASAPCAAWTPLTPNCASWPRCAGRSASMVVVSRRVVRLTNCLTGALVFQPVLFGERQSHQPVTASAGLAAGRPVLRPVGRDARRRAVVHAGVRRRGRRRPRRVVAGTSAHGHMPAANINAGVRYCGSCYGYRQQPSAQDQRRCQIPNCLHLDFSTPDICIPLRNAHLSTAPTTHRGRRPIAPVSFRSTRCARRRATH